MQINAGETDIWVLDLARGVKHAADLWAGGEYSPHWSPDGVWLVYSIRLAMGTSALYRKHADGSGVEEQLVSDDRQVLPTDWSRDGKFLLYSRPLDGRRPAAADLAAAS